MSLQNYPEINLGLLFPDIWCNSGQLNYLEQDQNNFFFPVKGQLCRPRDKTDIM